MTNHTPRVTFGLIVLNGEPFTRYCLRGLYAFAHQIIVVEGACRAAAPLATADGHSTDGTLAVLRRFQAEEDPEGKVVIVTAEDEGAADGFWEEKDAMSQAYARRATGNYLWQVDVDEFYRPRDLAKVVEMLAARPEVTAVSFRTHTFWGGLEYVADSLHLRCGARDYHRLFAWGPGYRYVTHRPPTVVDAAGVDLRRRRWLPAGEMAFHGVYLYHYSLLLPKQVEEKCAYYTRAPWSDHARQADAWARECYLALRQPFRVHNLYDSRSWLARFPGVHPPEAVRMVAMIAAGKHPGIALRACADVEALLARPGYRLGRLALRLLTPAAQVWHGLRRLLARAGVGRVRRRLVKAREGARV